MPSTWKYREAIAAHLEREQGTLRKEAQLPVALTYPSPYRVAMSSLGYQTLYREINSHPGASAERAFLPDEIEEHRQGRLPILTYETARPLSGFPVIAFSLAYELELPGLLECLSLAGLAVRASERRANDPLIVVGGPLSFSNPLPAAPFADVLVLGEAEETIHTLLDQILADPRKEHLLSRLAGMPGFYVPTLGGPLGAIATANQTQLPAFSQVITPSTELASMFLIENARGCSRGCTYCVMGRWSGGMRMVPAEEVLARIPEYAQRVGLVGAAVSDHPQLLEMVRTIVESGREIGLSSLRADRLSQELAHWLKRGGYRTLTTASDGASERLRRFIDRKTQEKHLLRAAEWTRDAGLERLKLYQMIGLPSETEQDIDELARFSLELARIAPRLTLGIAPFVPKRRTPLDRSPFEPIRSLERKLRRLRQALGGQVEIRPTSARWAYVEYRLAQGGPEAGLAALEAWQQGGSFAAWKQALGKIPEPEVVMPQAEPQLHRVRLRPPIAHPFKIPQTTIIPSRL